MSEPTPVVALDYADPKRPPAEPVLRVMGWLNAVLGGVGTLGVAVTLATGAFTRYGYSAGRGPPFAVWLTAATTVLQLVAGFGLVRRLHWGTRTTAVWAVAAVAVQAIEIAIYAGQMWGYRAGNLGYVGLSFLTSITNAAVPLAYAILCGAVVWWRPEVMGKPMRSDRP